MIIKTSANLFFTSKSDQPKSNDATKDSLDLPQINRKPFYFLRHGQTDLNLERRHQGQQDTPLNERGKEQAHNAASILANHEINSICSSPLLRARETSEIIAKKMQCDIYYLENLKERFKGEAEGLLYKECNFETTFSKLTDEEPLGAESNKNFLNRTICIINEALQMPDPILLVTHGAVLCCLCFYLKIALADKIERANCLPLLFSPTDNGWEVKIVT